MNIQWANTLSTFCSLISSQCSSQSLSLPIFWSEFSSLDIPRKGNSFCLTALMQPLHLSSHCTLTSQHASGSWAIPESHNSPRVLVRDTPPSLSPCRQLLAPEELHFYLDCRVSHQCSTRGGCLPFLRAEPSSADEGRYLLLCKGSGHKWLLSLDMGSWKGERMKGKFSNAFKEAFSHAVFIFSKYSC